MPKDKPIMLNKVRLSFPSLERPEGPQSEVKWSATAAFTPAMAVMYRTERRPWWQRWMWWLSPVIAVFDFESFAQEHGARKVPAEEPVDDLAALDAHEADTAATDDDPMGHAPGRKRRTRVVVEFDDQDGDGWRRAAWTLQTALQNHPTFRGRHVHTMHPTRLVQAAGRRKDAGLTSPKT